MWVKYARVIFADNPVGTGWSYADSVYDFTITNKEVADDLVQFVRRFYDIFSEFQTMYIMVEK